MGGFLLLPEDELELVAHLLDAEGLVRLAHEDLAHGPRVAGPLVSPAALPEAPRAWTFWARGVGELVAGPGTSFVDHARSPVVVWHRCHWHPSGALCPGRLSSQTRRRAEQPEALLALYDRVHAWMKRGRVKIAPGPGVIRAFPQAAEWVREGGPVWSGDAH
jgi:hypothetical protein